MGYSQVRLFTFGCSFTRYHRWPTWADILGKQFNYYENWAQEGCGNSFILNSIVEAHQRNSFTSNDKICVMWSGISREDRYVRNKWLGLGNIYWFAGNPLPKEYIKKFTCERGYIIRDLANITLAKNLLDNIGCDYEFMSMVPLDRTTHDNDLGENENDNYLDDNSDVFDLYRDTLDSLHPSIYEIVYNFNWVRDSGIFDADNDRPDMHPTPKEHLMYLDYVFPDLINDRAREWALHWEDRARKNDHWQNKNDPGQRL